MSREAHVPFCERLRVQLPRPTHRFNLSHRDIDEVFLKLGGKQHYLWRGVEQYGDVIDVFLQG